MGFDSFLIPQVRVAHNGFHYGIFNRDTGLCLIINESMPQNQIVEAYELGEINTVCIQCKSIDYMKEVIAIAYAYHGAFPKTVFMGKVSNLAAWQESISLIATELDCPLPIFRKLSE